MKNKVLINSVFLFAIFIFCSTRAFSENEQDLCTIEQIHLYEKEWSISCPNLKSPTTSSYDEIIPFIEGDPIKLRHIVESFLSEQSIMDTTKNQLVSSEINTIKEQLPKKWVTNAATRIFSDKMRSFLEIVVNACDSLIPKDKKSVGKFGMGFFSTLAFLLNEETDGATIDVSTCYELDNGELYAYKIDLKNDEDGDITATFEELDPKIFDNHTGTKITIKPTNSFSEEMLYNIRYYIHYLDFYQDARIELNFQKEFSETIGDPKSIESVRCDLLKNELIVEDRGYGISLETAFTKLLVPSSSDKGIGNILQHKETILTKNEDAPPIHLVNFKGKIDENQSHFLISVNNVIVVDKKIDEPIMNHNGDVIDIIINMPQETELTLARNEIKIALDGESFEEKYIKKAIKQSILTLFSDEHSKSNNISLAALYKGLDSWEKQSSAQHIRGRFTTFLKQELNRIIENREDIILIPLHYAYYLKDILNKKSNKKFIAIDDDIADYNYAKLENHLEYFFQKNIDETRNSKHKAIMQKGVDGKLIAGKRIFFIQPKYLPKTTFGKNPEISSFGLRTSLFVPIDLLKFKSEDKIKNSIIDLYMDQNLASYKQIKDRFVMISTNQDISVPEDNFIYSKDWFSLIINNINNYPRFISKVAKTFSFFKEEDTPLLLEFFNKHKYLFLDQNITELTLFGKRTLEIYDSLEDALRNKANNNKTMDKQFSGIYYVDPKDLYFVDYWLVDLIDPKDHNLSWKEIKDKKTWEKHNLFEVAANKLRKESINNAAHLKLHEFMNYIFACLLAPTIIDPSLDKYTIFVEKEKLSRFKEDWSLQDLESFFYEFFCDDKLPQLLDDLVTEKSLKLKNPEKERMKNICRTMNDSLTHDKKTHQNQCSLMVKNIKDDINLENNIFKNPSNFFSFTEKDNDTLRLFFDKYRDFFLRSDLLRKYYLEYINNYHSITDLAHEKWGARKPFRKIYDDCESPYYADAILFCEDSNSFLARNPCKIQQYQNGTIPYLVEREFNEFASDIFHQDKDKIEKARHYLSNQNIYMPMHEFMNHALSPLLMPYNIEPQDKEKHIFADEKKVWPIEGEWTVEKQENLFFNLLLHHFSYNQNDHTRLLKTEGIKTPEVFQDRTALFLSSSNLDQKTISLIKEIALKDIANAIFYEDGLKYAVSDLKVTPHIIDLLKWYDCNQESKKRLNEKNNEQVQKMRETILSHYNKYFNIPDSSFRRVYGEASVVQPITSENDISNIDEAYKLLVDLQEFNSTFDKLISFQIMDFEFQTDLSIREESIANKSLYIPSTLANTPISILATLREKKVPLEIIKTIIDKSQNPEELMFISYILLQDECLGIFYAIPDKTKNQIVNAMALVIEHYLRERVDKLRISDLYHKNRAQKSLSARIKIIKDESATKIITSYLKRISKEKTYFKKQGFFVSTKLDKELNLAFRRNSSFSLKQLINSYFSNNELDKIFKSNSLDKITQKIQEANPTLKVGKISQNIESGSEKSSIESSFTETLQNSIDIITGFLKAKENEDKSITKSWDKRNLSTEELKKSIAKINYSLGFMENIDDKDSDKTHMVITIQDKVGFKNPKTLLADFALPDYSNKSSSYGNFGEMGNGMFKIYQNARRVVILTRFVENPDKTFLLLITPKVTSFSN